MLHPQGSISVLGNAARQHSIVQIQFIWTEKDLALNRIESSNGQDRLHILFLLPSLKRAGAEIQVVNLVRNLDPARFQVTLVTFQEEQDLAGDLLLSWIQYIPLKKTRFFDFSLAREIAAIIDTNCVDIVHCSLQYPMMIGVTASGRSDRRPPVVNAIHTTKNADWKHELTDFLLYQWLMRKCETNVFVCETQREHWVRKFPFMRTSAQVVHNGVDLEKFRDQRVDEQQRADLRISLDLPENSKIICCVAGFRPEKAHCDLLRAFKILQEREPNTILVLAGDGPLRYELNKLSVDLGLESSIRMTGVLQDVRPLLAISDVSVLCSKAVETFSMAMLESLAMGVPVVSTDIGGAKEAISDGENGRLVPIRAPRLLASAIYDVIESDDRNRSMSDSARISVLDFFSVEKMTSNMSGQFRELAARHLLIRGMDARKVVTVSPAQ